MNPSVVSFTVRPAKNGYSVYVDLNHKEDVAERSVEYVFPTTAKLKKFLNVLLKKEEA